MRNGMGWVLLCCVIAIPAGVAGDEVMREDFDAPGGTLPDGWRPLQGQWAVQDRALVGEGSEAYILFGDEAWQNYEIEVTATFQRVRDDSRWFSVLFRAANDGAPPWMQVPVRFRSTLRNGTEFAVRTGDGWSVRQTAKAKADSVLGQARRLRVTVCGSNVRALPGRRTGDRDGLCGGSRTRVRGFGAERRDGAIRRFLGQASAGHSAADRDQGQPLRNRRAPRLVGGVPREHTAGREDGRAGRRGRHGVRRPSHPRRRGRAAARQDARPHDQRHGRTRGRRPSPNCVPWTPDRGRTRSSPASRYPRSNSICGR